MEPVWTADCASRRLDPGTPIKAAIKTSGSVSADQPDAAFYGAFLADPQFHLPAGDWDISAVASFLEGSDCTGASHEMTATVRLRVAP